MKFSLANRVIRFLFAGAAGAAVNLFFLYLFTGIFGLWYLYGSILAFCLAVSVSFTLQKFWVFQENNQRWLLGQAALFLSLAIFNVGLNVFLMYFLVDFWFFHYLLAQIISSGLIAVWSFLAYRHLIFKPAVP